MSSSSRFRRRTLTPGAPPAAPTGTASPLFPTAEGRDLFFFSPFQSSHLSLDADKKKTLSSGWTDKQNRPGIDPVDEACRAHDACYGQAHEDQPPEHKIRRAAAECGCDKKLVSALKDFKKNKQQQAEATKAAKRAANDMIDLFDLKCPISVAGAVLRPPSPATAPGGGGQGKC